MYYDDDRDYDALPLSTGLDFERGRELPESIVIARPARPFPWIECGVGALALAAVIRKAQPKEKKMAERGEKTNEREAMYISAMRVLDVPEKLRALAAKFEEQGCTSWHDVAGHRLNPVNPAEMLRKRAALKELPEDVKEKRREALRRGLASVNKPGVYQLSDMFEGTGALKAAERLREHAAGLPDVPLATQPAAPVASHAGDSDLTDIGDAISPAGGRYGHMLSEERGDQISSTPFYAGQSADFGAVSRPRRSQRHLTGPSGRRSGALHPIPRSARPGAPSNVAQPTGQDSGGGSSGGGSGGGDSGGGDSGGGASPAQPISDSDDGSGDGDFGGGYRLHGGVQLPRFGLSAPTAPHGASSRYVPHTAPSHSPSSPQGHPMGPRQPRTPGRTLGAGPASPHSSPAAPQAPQVRPGAPDPGNVFQQMGRMIQKNLSQANAPMPGAVGPRPAPPGLSGYVPSGFRPAPPGSVSRPAPPSGQSYDGFGSFSRSRRQFVDDQFPNLSSGSYDPSSYSPSPPAPPAPPAQQSTSSAGTATQGSAVSSSTDGTADVAAQALQAAQAATGAASTVATAASTLASTLSDGGDPHQAATSTSEDDGTATPEDASVGLDPMNGKPLKGPHAIRGDYAVEGKPGVREGMMRG